MENIKLLGILNNILSSRSYIGGKFITKIDIWYYKNLFISFDFLHFPHFYRWYHHIRTLIHSKYSFRLIFEDLFCSDITKIYSHGLSHFNLINYSIKPLSSNNIKDLQLLASTIWKNTFLNIITFKQIEYMLHQRYNSEIINDELKKSHIWWDIMIIDEEMIGYCSYYLTNKSDLPDSQYVEMKIDKIYIHPKFQFHGLGNRFFNHIIAKSHNHNCNRIILAVNKHHFKAITTYIRWGFEIEKEIVKNIGGGFIMDDYIMMFHIHPKIIVK